LESLGQYVDITSRSAAVGRPSHDHSARFAAAANRAGTAR
jgi:hypothetical protein